MGRAPMLVGVVAAAALAVVAPRAPAADRDPGALSMALVNMKCLRSDGPDAGANRENVRRNLERHLWFVDRVAAEGAEFVGFPELSLNGYWFSDTMAWLRLDGPEVRALADRAAARGVAIAAGLAEQDAAGRRWNTHVVLGSDGRIVGRHRKRWLTGERGFTEPGTDTDVFEVKGLKIGIATCADCSDYALVKALVDNGARLVYGPHANTTGGTTEGWYAFRARWGGAWDGTTVPADPRAPDPRGEWPAGGWCHRLGIYAALHNHAALYDPAFDPPAGADEPLKHWASGAWFISPEGVTLGQMPSSPRKIDSREYVLRVDIPTGDGRPSSAGD